MIIVKVKKSLITTEGRINLEVNLEIEEGEFATLFGASGAGKTTILRMIAGLTDPQEGLIQIGDEVWFDSQRRINLPPQKRKVGFVFQEQNLFPHMTVRENLEFALSDKKNMALIDELLAMAHLKELANQRPPVLSVGQKQRVALIRAMVRNPKIFLLDEPLSSLDIGMRAKLQDEIINLYKRFKITTIFVSHDLSEVFKLSQRVFLLEGGRIKKSGAPSEIFARHQVSGKFKFTGEIIEIKKDSLVNILTIQIGNHLTKVVATDEEIQNLQAGDRIMVAAKAFNPIILKYPSAKQDG